MATTDVVKRNIEIARKGYAAFNEGDIGRGGEGGGGGGRGGGGPGGLLPGAFFFFGGGGRRGFFPFF